MAKTKAHIRYKDADGVRVVGTTTVTGLLAKPQLVPWANRMGLNGIDTSKYVDDKASIGTLAHDMIMCHILKADVDTSDYSENQIKQANNCVKSYMEWEKTHKIDPIIVEVPMINEAHKYGGTVDLYCKIGNDKCLIDFKTGKAIYSEMGYQLSAYKQILLENGHQVDNCRILRIGRDESEGFEERYFTNLDNDWDIFYHLLQIYKLRKN